MLSYLKLGFINYLDIYDLVILVYNINYFVVKIIYFGILNYNDD